MSKLKSRVIVTVNGLPNLSKLDVLEIATYLVQKAAEIEEVARYSTQSQYSDTFRMRLLK